jgi:hypothetical protein
MGGFCSVLALSLVALTKSENVARHLVLGEKI